jgi:Domain of unknown function (DUF6504)
MQERFVSEAIRPLGESTDTRGMAAGEPGLPHRFAWNDLEYEVAEVLETWKTTSGCSHGAAEEYVRKHWFRIRTTDDSEMKIYFERQARSVAQRATRWWLFTIATSE